MTMPDKVRAAFDNVRARFPRVNHVFYSRDGRWQYTDEVFDAPNFGKTPISTIGKLMEEGEPARIDVSLLEEAANAAYDDKGWPCAYALSEDEDDA